MFETKHIVTIECPGLAKAISDLRAILSSGRPIWDDGIVVDKPTASAPAQPAPVPAASVAPVQPQYYTPPAQPQTSPATQAPAVTTQPAPMAPPPMVPTPAFTLEQISRAGADLVSMDAAKLPVLLQLLQRFGINSVDQLKPEHYGAFATELRGLGAKL